MRIRIRHETSYRYATPPTRVIQTLRKMPRDHAGQTVISWHIDIDQTARMTKAEDAFGNITHTFTVENCDSLTILAEGEIQTENFDGVIAGAVERFAPALYLRETPLTEPDAALAAFADEVAAAAGPDRLRRLHELMAAIHRDVAFDTAPTDASTTAAQAFAMKRGVCQDLTHVFLAAARHMGSPARYVSGYFRRGDDVDDQEASHAWAEAYVDDLGWVSFDPANGICATAAHVRVAVGLDYLNAAPIRGSRYGGEAEHLHVALSVTDQ